MRLLSPLRTIARRPNRAVSAVRQYSKSPISVAFKTGDDEEDETQLRYRTQKNPVIPSIQGLDKRWVKLDAGKQDDIIAFLEDKMRSDWNTMSLDEKRAAWFVWFGNWGPRSSTSKDMAHLYVYVAGCIGISMIGLGIYKYSVWDPKQEVPGIDYDSLKE